MVMAQEVWEEDIYHHHYYTGLPKNFNIGTD